MLDRVTEQSREIGRLETQVFQLVAPLRDMSRHNTTDDDADVVVSEKTLNDAIDVEPEPPNVVASRQSVWTKLFG